MRSEASLVSGSGKKLHAVGSDPKQQLAYLAVKYWARLYCPGVILGVYTPDEFEQKECVKGDVTPARTRQDLNNLINQWQAEPAQTESSHAKARTPEELLKEFTEAATKASGVDELDNLYKYAARKLSANTEKLDMATDVYNIRRDELSSTAQ